MEDKRLGRRAFLKVAAATTAAGLSHFQFLNLGSQVAYAYQCQPGEDPDICQTAGELTDWCVGQSSGEGDPDVCPDDSFNGTDTCPDNSPDGSDVCNPEAGEPDACGPVGEPAEPDTCDPIERDPDACLGDEAGDGDVCNSDDRDVCYGDDQGGDACGANDPDICEDNDTCGEPEGVADYCPADLNNVDACEPEIGEPDECFLAAGGDTCEPAADEADLCLPDLPDPDLCLDGSSGDGDKCQPEDHSPDVCAPNDEPDECPGGPGDVDEPSSDPDPTSVEMAAFQAGWRREGVEIRWQTVSEIDCLGFVLYRSLDAKSGYQRVNEDLIPCQSPGSPLGALYTYLDDGAKADTVYYYVIEAQDIHGHANRYGPVQANPLRRLRPVRTRPAPRSPRLSRR